MEMSVSGLNIATSPFDQLLRPHHLRWNGLYCLRIWVDSIKTANFFRCGSFFP